MTVTKRTGKENKATSKEKTVDEVKEPKYGPLPRFSNQRIWSRGIIIFGVIIYVWYTSKDVKETVLAKQSDIYERRSQSFECDPKYLEEIKAYPGCVPTKCGRVVSDKVITAFEVDTLLKVAVKGMHLGGSDGGATILDLHSGALSYKDKFINIYSLKTAKKFITPADLAVYKIAREKIQKAVAESFGILYDKIHLTHPTFFSKLTNADPKTEHDEYWHVHVDKNTYKSFHYTSLLYLNDYNVDFKGGRFIFLDNIENPKKNTTVEPRKGRLSMFSSGAENPHFVERVKEGTRYAITVSFTCDPEMAINDPTMQ